MSLNTNSLITVEELATFKGISTNLTDAQRSQTELYINMASTYIETALERTLMSGSLATETFSGLRYKDIEQTEYITKQAPITSTPSLQYRSDSNTWTDVAAGTWSYNSTDGMIYMIDGYYFDEGIDNYRVRYQYGYANTAAIPQDLKLATMLLCRRYEGLQEHYGISSQSSTDGRSTSYDYSQLPNEVTNVLKRYTRK